MTPGGYNMGFDLNGFLQGGLAGLFTGAGTFAKDVRAAITGKSVLTAEEQTALLQQAAQLETAVLSAEQQVNLAQIDIDKTEAASPCVFVSGWRPAVAWVCVFGFAYQFVLQPFIGYGLSIHSTYHGLPIPPPPTLDSTQMMTLLLGLLGLGGMRTIEKVNGVANVNLTQPSDKPNK